MQRQRSRFAVLQLLGLLALGACAGPMDPFGAKPLIQKPQALDQQSEYESDTVVIAYEDVEPSLAATSPSRVPASQNTLSINFHPARKLWHRSFDLNVTVTDHEKIPPNSKVNFFYDGQDVTERVLKIAQIKYGASGTKVSYKIPAFRLLPEHDKPLVVTYTKLDPIGNDQMIAKIYEEPHCPLSELQQLTKPTQEQGFYASTELFDQIRILASFHHINPAFLAGLIAQESSFDASAVSTAKALGLTQITALAEKHILDDLGERATDWPRYPGLEKMNPLEIKAMIKLGKINADNEWRLAHERSIQGGIAYLKYIQQYWRSFAPAVDRQLASLHQNKKVDTMVDIILASYNSGPYRVRKNLNNLGTRWLEAHDLGEARKYVHKVKSYCYDFARGY